MSTLRNAKSSFMVMLVFTAAFMQLSPALLAGDEKPHTGSNSGFVENKGQVYDQHNELNGDVLFLWNSPGMNIQLRKTGFSYDTYQINRKTAENEDRAFQLHRVDVSFPGSDLGCVPVGLERLPEYLNYYNHQAGEAGITSVKKFSKIRYPNLYPNIDLEFELTPEKGLEYNFIVHPGASVADIRMQFTGQDKLTVSGERMYELAFDGGKIEETIPEIYSTSASMQKTTLGGGYRNMGASVLGFWAEGWDHTSTLVIDPLPMRLWGTYYGGSSSETTWNSTVAVDKYGNSYLIGTTESSSPASNIASAGAFKDTLNTVGSYDMVVAKFGPNGNRIWGTYYGGSGPDYGYAITVDDSENVVCVGTTQTITSTAIATTGCWQPTFGGGTSSALPDAFVVKFDSTGRRKWGTYYGGEQEDVGRGVATDRAGNIFIVGSTYGSAAPYAIASPGAHAVIEAGGLDIFLVKFNPAGVRLWGTYYGDSVNEEGFDVATDTAGNVYITGRSNTPGTAPNGVATSGCFQPTNAGGYDAIVAKFNPAGVLKWGTYYGDSSDEYGFGINLDKSSNILICGETNSMGSAPNGIATSGCFQPAYAGGADAFVAKFSPAGSRVWGTYYGGSGVDVGYDIASDKSGNIFLGGYTTTTGSAPNALATTGAWQPAYGGGYCDAYVAKFDPSGNRVWGTYYGGSADDWGWGVATDVAGNVFLAGYCGTPGTAPNAIASAGCEQPAAGGGGSDLFLVKLQSCDTAGVSRNTTNPTCNGNSNGKVTLSVSGGAEPYLYSWHTVPVQTASTLTGVQAGTYTCTITDAGSCITTATITLTQPPAVSVAILARDSITCKGVADTLLGSGASAYSWAPAAGLNASTGEHVYATPSATTTYTLTGTNTAGCLGTNTFTLTINPDPATPVIQATGNILGSSVSGASYVWTLNGTVLANDNGQKITAGASGNYTVEVFTSFGCSAVSVPYSYTATGISSLSGNVSYKVYPNPASAYIMVDVPQPGCQLMVTVFDTQGRELKIVPLNSSRVQISCIDLPDGVYLYQVHDSGRPVATGRFAILH